MTAISKLTADSIKEPGPDNTLMGKVNEVVDAANNASGNGTPGAGTFTTLSATGTTSVNTATGGLPTSLSSGLPGSAYVVHPASNYGMVVARGDNSTSGANLVLHKTRGGGDASVKGAVATGDNLGQISWQPASDGSTVVLSASIAAVANGTVAPGSVPTDLSLRTGTGAVAATERIRIGSGGEIKLGVQAGDKLGFYGTTPIAQQTGVAVTAAAIHAALVALGLITA